MSSESEEPKKNGPPPPSIKPPITPPPPSIPATPATPASAPPSSTPPLKVKVKEGSDEDELETPVEDDDSKIPMGTRVVAILIDLGIAIGLYVGVLIVSGFTLHFLGSLAYPVAIAFILTRDGLPFLNGQSPGKTAMKIKAVTLDGKSLAGNWQPALIRNAVLLIPFFMIVELIVLLTREDKPDQGIRLGDEWAKTRVVHADPPEAEVKESEASGKPEA